jgi:outer membrane lipoprotein SlyB
MARRFALLASLALLVLAACATRPIVYPNQKLRESGQVAVQADTEACFAEAEEYLESGRVPELAKRTGEGAVVGGAVGAAVGAVKSSVGRGAAAGAAGGAAGGLAHGLLHWRDPDPVEKRYVERCLAERGYDVIGWR